MKKRFIVIGTSVLLAVTLLTAFCASAQPPRKAQVIGAVLNGDGTTGTRNLNIIPVNNNVFGVYSTTDLELCTRVYLYFATSYQSITSFSLQLKVLSDAFSLGTQSTAYCRLNNISSTGVVTDSTTLGSNIQLNTDTSNKVLSWVYNGTVTGRSAFLVTINFQNFMLGSTPLYFEMVSLSVNGESTPLTYSDQKLEQIFDYESSGGSSDTEGASELVEDIAGDVSNINSTINSHKPNVSNWLSTSLVATDLVNIALLANSWLPAYLSCDPDVYFYWSLVTFCIVLCLIENGLRRRPWHGFDDGGDFETDYDVTSTDEKGRSRTIHNKVVGSRRRRR